MIDMYEQYCIKYRIAIEKKIVSLHEKSDNINNIVLSVVLGITMAMCVTGSIFSIKYHWYYFIPTVVGLTYYPIKQYHIVKRIKMDWQYLYGVSSIPIDIDYFERIQTFSTNYDKEFCVNRYFKVSLSCVNKEKL